MAGLVPNAQQQFFDRNGSPLSGGLVYMYVPGTTTPATTWVDVDLTVANTNPIVLDPAGRASIWGNTTYRQVVTTQLGDLQWDLLTKAP